MSKATYHIKETKNTRSFSYSGDLAEAIKKAEKDLEAEKNNKDMQHWKWLYKKAKAAITAHDNKIDRISAFIRCAKAQLQKQQAAESEAGE